MAEASRKGKDALTTEEILVSHCHRITCHRFLVARAGNPVDIQ